MFYFSVVFLNRGIDSWFHVEIRAGLEDALTLSRAALDIRMRQNLDRTRVIAAQIAAQDGDRFYGLDELRATNDAVELTVLGTSSHIIATSSDRLGEIIPGRAGDEVLMQVRQGRDYVALDPLAGGGYLVRTAVQVPRIIPGQDARIVLAVYPVERRLGELADTVESAYQNYNEKARLREPLKDVFTLTLTNNNAVPGVSTATGVTVKDVLPAGLSFPDLIPLDWEFFADNRNAMIERFEREVSSK